MKLTHNHLPAWAMAPVRRKAITTLVIFSLIVLAFSLFNASVQYSATQRRIKQSQSPPLQPQGDTSFTFDPRPLLTKHNQDVEGLQPDGSYLLYHDMFQGGPDAACSPLIAQKDRVTSIHYHYARCKDFDRQFGNRLATMYGMKLVANSLRVPFRFTCGMEEGEKGNGASFLMNLNDVDIIRPIPIHNNKHLSPEETCGLCGVYCTWYNPHLALASETMIHEWNYLVQPHLVPVQPSDGVHYDEAVIHLRLGDGLFSTHGTNEYKGVFPHETYVRLLRLAEEERGQLTSIGIITAPFKGDNVRQWDAGYTSLSEMIALDLVRALKDAFPYATVHLHNRPDESIMESLARVVYARKVAICGCSTFCPYPLLISRGIGFIYNPMGEQNIWVRNAAERYPNFRLFDTPMLNGMMISNLKTGWELKHEEVLNWLRNQRVDVGNVDIVEEPLFRDK